MEPATIIQKGGRMFYVVFVEEESTSEAHQTERMVQIETNLDDLSPQAYEYIMEQLFQVGAVDVALIPVVMKKSRPGVVLSCLASRKI